MRFTVAGVNLDGLSRQQVLERIAHWCRKHDGRSRSVSFVNAFSIVMASRDPGLMAAINGCDLSVIDGVPVSWVGRRLVDAPCERFSGPDLMHQLLRDPDYADITHFVYGGDQASLERLAFRYNRGGTVKPARIIGTHSPPYRNLSPEEEADVISRIENLSPDIVWVCLGTGRQEEWMARMSNRLHGPVLAAVGAAVDFLSGNKPRAPRIMQKAGLEWLFRLATEPRRLWRRYLIGNIEFLRLAGAEIRRRHPQRGGEA